MKVYISRYRKYDKKKPDRPGRVIRVGISDDDCFSLDDTLAHIIHPALIRFKGEGLCSFPGTLSSSEEWVALLDKMIFSFGELINDNAGEPEYSREEGSEFKKYSESLQEGFELFGKWYNHLWW